MTDLSTTAEVSHHEALQIGMSTLIAITTNPSGSIPDRIAAAAALAQLAIAWDEDLFLRESNLMIPYNNDTVDRYTIPTRHLTAASFPGQTTLDATGDPVRIGDIVEIVAPYAGSRPRDCYNPITRATGRIADVTDTTLDIDWFTSPLDEPLAYPVDSRIRVISRVVPNPRKGTS